MRKKGSRNKGFWYRKGRVWYVGTDKLLDPDGKHIRDESDQQAAEKAYHTLMANGLPQVADSSPISAASV